METVELEALRLVCQIRFLGTGGETDLRKLCFIPI